MSVPLDAVDGDEVPVVDVRAPRRWSAVHGSNAADGQVVLVDDEWVDVLAGADHDGVTGAAEVDGLLDVEVCRAVAAARTGVVDVARRGLRRLPPGP